MLAAWCLVGVLWMSLGATAGEGGDWPQWRFDAHRSASSPHELPAQLHLQWTRTYAPRTPVWDDPLNQDLMPYDRILEPIVAGDRVILGLNDRDRVVALDLNSGAEAWNFITDGPVRLPPASAEGWVFAASDDGYLYGLDAATGAERWRIRGGPTARKVLGNKRLIGAWPMRGGPVCRDGEVYCAASIWPFMGTFIYALDARTGKVKWLNDGSAADFIQQPHSAPSFAGVAPQGALAATEKFLVVPGGRSIPAVFDRATGNLAHFELAKGGKGNGGSFVCANEEEFFSHTRERGVRAFTLANGAKGKFAPNEPVLDGATIYAADPKDPKVAAYEAAGADKKKLWEVEADASGDLIRAGNRLYAAGQAGIAAIELPAAGGTPRVIWTLPVQGEILRLLAARGRLLAVLSDGRLLCFGADAKAAPQEWRETAGALAVPAEAGKLAEKLTAAADAKSGYAICFGIDDGAWPMALVNASALQVIALDERADAVARLRARADAAGVYGTRLTAHAAEPRAFEAPPYMAHLVLVGREAAARYAAPETLPALYRSVRPYGGALWIPEAPGVREAVAAQVKDGVLEGAKLREEAGGFLLVREGALPGSAPWTHLYGNIANTVKSDDKRVRLPLGLLWFGGSSNLDVLPRHGHGPSEQVIGGRLFVMGMDLLNARDVYTGRVLWQRKFADLGVRGIYFDDTHKDTPLETAYNQVHIPGANARGTNFIATAEAIYVAAADGCHELDPKTGEARQTIKLPRLPGQAGDPEWGFIGVYEDLLLGGTGFAHFSKKLDEAGAAKQTTWSFAVDVSASEGLAAIDRKTGAVRWTVPAKHGFIHNGIVAGNGRIYALDRLPLSIEERFKRLGVAIKEPYRILALDAATGKVLWERTEPLFGSWLGYSEEHDLLLQAGANATDRLRDEAGAGLAVFKGADGAPVWKDLKRKYTGPCILHGDAIITTTNSYKVSSGILSLLDGSEKRYTNPLTGELEPLRFTRTYGCNTAIASEHLLTFRSGAAGFFDWANRSGTGNFGGFKSGCTSNLVVADGVLNAPDYTRTCSCGYQNQTSLALVPMPELELWTYRVGGQNGGASIVRAGVNLGAPGDRQAEDGTLWLEYPEVGAKSMGPEVKAEGEGLKWFRHHAMRMDGTGHPWVVASGVQNLRKLTLRLHVAQGPALNTSVLADGADDAEETADGTIDLRSSDLELAEDAGPQTAGIRFKSVKLSATDKLLRAYLQFSTDEPSGGPCELTIRAEAADQAAAFTGDRHNLSKRSLTQAQVVWKPKRWVEEDDAAEEQRSPDLAPLLKEIVSRPGWKSGQALAFLITGKGKRVAKSFDRDKDEAPSLVLELEREESALPDTPAGPSRSYTVKLYFMEPDPLAAGQRVFDVKLQGQAVLSGLDVSAEAGGPGRGLAKEFKNVRVDGLLQIDLVPAAGSAHGPVLCGIEAIQETK